MLADGGVQPGEVLQDRFHVLRRLGRGGSADVLECEDLESGGRIALKLAHARELSERRRARFLNEARLVTHLKHPHVCTVYEAGVFADGRPYLVLELLFGASCATVIHRTGALELGDATHTVMQVLSALDALHARSIVHRDLKPANVFLVETPGGPPLVKLIDLGLGRSLEAHDTRFTPSGCIVGTPGYVAPELFAAPRDADHRVDVYGAGLLLYEAIAGQNPFRSRTLGDLAIEIHRGPPPLRMSAPGVPSLVEDVVRIAMNRDPRERFATAAAMREALRVAMRGLDLRPTGRLRVGQEEAEPVALASTGTDSV